MHTCKTERPTLQQLFCLQRYELTPVQILSSPAHHRVQLPAMCATRNRFDIQLAFQIISQADIEGKAFSLNLLLTKQAIEISWNVSRVNGYSFALLPL